MTIVLVPGHNPGPMTGAGTNTYLLPGRVPTLIDAASGESAHLEALESALRDGGGELAQVLVTHAHPDHAGGAALIRLRWPKATFRKMRWPEHAADHGIPWAWMTDGDVVPAGDGSVRAVHTPGHAPDHLCFFDDDTRSLFTGDLVVGEGTVVIPPSAGGSLQQYLESLRRVAALEPARLLPGHGPAVEDPMILIARYLAHRHQREQQITDTLERGPATVESIVEVVYGQLEQPFVRMAAESVTAHLLKLELEGRVAREGIRWALVR
jgi:glyoxylase-like metal-dependent hydrolase (beta-lactamase superfamily II)